MVGSLRSAISELTPPNIYDLGGINHVYSASAARRRAMVVYIRVWWREQRRHMVPVLSMHSNIKRARPLGRIGSAPVDYSTYACMRDI